ncbi:MAG: ribosome silencing factor [Nitrospirae bacterium]|nr:ribosome silencing factor [Nitrospirota bacterium]
MDSRTKAIAAARASLDKKAKDVQVLELRGLTVIADYFVICSGESTTQTRTIAEHIKETLRQDDVSATRVEGLDYSRWILMDYGDVIVHVFEEETRLYYELEKLWLDAPRIAFADEDKDNLDRENKREISARRDRAIS